MKIKDNLVIGLLMGIIAPTIGIYLFYITNFKHTAFQEFLKLAFQEKLIAPLLSLSCIINLAIFYIFLRFEHYNSARGIITATFLYGFVIIVLKFFV